MRRKSGTSNEVRCDETGRLASEVLAEKEIRYVERGSIPRIHEATSVTYPPMIRSLWRAKPNVPPKR
jgi:hypothetical protein